MTNSQNTGSVASFISMVLCSRFSGFYNRKYDPRKKVIIWKNVVAARKVKKVRAARAANSIVPYGLAVYEGFIQPVENAQSFMGRYI